MAFVAAVTFMSIAEETDVEAAIAMGKARHGDYLVSEVLVPRDLHVSSVTC
jgi:hypothetical protein